MKSKFSIICKFLTASLLVCCSLIFFLNSISAARPISNQNPFAGSQDLLMQLIVEIQWESELSLKYLHSPRRNMEQHLNQQSELLEQRERTDFAFHELEASLKNQQNPQLENCLNFVFKKLQQLNVYRSELDLRQLNAPEIKALYDELSDQVLFRIACVN